MQMSITSLKKKRKKEKKKKERKKETNGEFLHNAWSIYHLVSVSIPLFDYSFIIIMMTFSAG